MLSIPDPCPQSWERMQVRTEGRYCASCCRTVVDFSLLTNDEIHDYFNRHAGQRICARVHRSQLKPVPRKRLVRFLAGIFFVFGSALFAGCGTDENEHVVGDVGLPYDSAQAAVKADSLAKAHFADSAENAEKHKPSVLSKEDSTRVADSLHRSKDHVRDFD